MPIHQKSSVARDQIDEHNDMQVLERDTRIDMPLFTPLPLLHGHHWDSVLQVVGALKLRGLNARLRALRATA